MGFHTTWGFVTPAAVAAAEGETAWTPPPSVARTRARMARRVLIRPSPWEDCSRWPPDDHSTGNRTGEEEPRSRTDRSERGARGVGEPQVGDPVRARSLLPAVGVPAR